ncbi:MAG: TraR/DksA C4-type zinc finger protein [Peptococcaceae bacterium]|nr:TraR/DksA C4-type zinc finger protein [Peptococcaceae bacterium]
MLREDDRRMLGAKLAAMRTRLAGLVQDITDDGLGRSLSDSTGELSTYDNHPADVGSEVFERSKDFSLRENARLTLRAVDEALERMAAGRYGVCTSCGVDIPLERLLAVPYTDKCVVCKKKDEEKGRSVRPVEEAVLQDLLVRSEREGGGDIQYDMEDAWQDVERTTEHAEGAGSGSYYGDSFTREERGYVEEVENIPWESGSDGVFYRSSRPPGTV